MTIEAIYRNGAFQPIEPVALEEGTHVHLTIDNPKEPVDPETVAQLLCELAALPKQNKTEFSGEDHDTLLYPREFTT